jgi:hypothetical protein
MPAPRTADELLDLVRKSGLADDERPSACLAELRAAGHLPDDPATVAGSLVRRGLLTVFQAEQLLGGKWRRFRIDDYEVLERLGCGRVTTVYLC